MRSTISVGCAALLVVSTFSVGCSGDSPLGGIGGQIAGDVASRTAGEMMTAEARRKAQQQEAEQLAAIQEAARQAAQESAAAEQTPIAP